MITGTDVYWITRMTYFQQGAIWLGAVFTLCGLIWVVCSIARWWEEDKPLMCLAAFPTLFVCLAILIGGLFIPNTKEICAIKVLPAIINNEDVQELPNKVVDLANEWLNELKPKKGETQ